MTPTNDHPRRLLLLGSTGSIGVNTLDVVKHLGAGFEVVGLAAGANAERLIEQARAFDVDHLAIADATAAEAIRSACPDATVYAGDDAALQLVEAVEADMLVGAMVGAAGLPATLRAIERGMTIALANKETLVAAGELVVPLARKHGVDLLPVDSEHSAIFQCLAGSYERRVMSYETRDGDGPAHRSSLVTHNSQVRRIILTASGGPFRETPKAEMDAATVDEALNHPTWQMGRKITIDSATMMNKALEIIEAHWLFGLPSDQIEVIIHPQSIAHSFVEFADHSILAQLGPPDMRAPIQYALTWPERQEGCARQLDWSQLRELRFEPPDYERFPSLNLAFCAIDAGGTAGAVLNAANEAAVEAFLDERITFGRITELVAAAMDAIPATPIHDLRTVLEADAAARDFVREQLDRVPA